MPLGRVTLLLHESNNKEWYVGKFHSTQLSVNRVYTFLLQSTWKTNKFSITSANSYRNYAILQGSESTKKVLSLLWTPLILITKQFL